jgi:transposase
VSVRNRHQQTWSAESGLASSIAAQNAKGEGLVLPSCNSAAMTIYLAEISAAVAPDAHAVLVMDQAGWHTSAKLGLPAKIIILTLPPRSPELNPVENIWQFMQDNWLSNRVFSSHDDIVDYCCDAWNKPVAQPWKILSIEHRKWAHR